MAMVNDYIMFRLLMEETDRKNQSRQMATHRNSLFIPRGSIGDVGQGKGNRCSEANHEFEWGTI